MTIDNNEMYDNKKDWDGNSRPLQSCDQISALSVNQSYSRTGTIITSSPWLDSCELSFLCLRWFTSMRKSSRPCWLTFSGTFLLTSAFASSPSGGSGLLIQKKRAKIIAGLKTFDSFSWITVDFFGVFFFFVA